MNLDRIRNMSDEELTSYLKNMSNKKNMNCYCCGKNGKNTILIKNFHNNQQKKLCTLCDDCYDKLLDFLNITDIIWDE